MSRAWPTLPPLPGPLIPVIDPSTGQITRDWYRYFSVLDPIVRGVVGLSLNDMADIDVVAPGDGQKLTWVAADSRWKGV